MPLDYRRALLTRHPRLRGVLEMAADKSGWGKPLAAGRARGVAACECFRSFVAQVAEVSVSHGYPRVHRVVCAVDCGQIVNPEAVRRQIEGGVVFGLSAALYGSITLMDGRVEQGDFDDYQVLRMDEAPDVDVHLLTSSDSPRFVTAGFGEFGRKMQTDLSDGVRYLAKEGIVDPARVCVVGSSYGGYAALAGVALEPGVYHCAVSVAGVSDWKQMLKWINEKHRERESREQRYWDRFMGVFGPSDPVLEQISPVKHVQSINAPILLIHGKDDTVVPYDQGDDMYDALRHAKKVVEFVKLQNEDHWLSRSETRVQMLQRTVAFLRKYNPPD